MKKFSIEEASELDIRFIINGISSICRIEKQEPEGDSVLITKTRKAIKNKRIKVARIDSKIVGFVQFDFSRKEPYGLDYGKRKRYCWIEWKYVAKNYRRKGIGKLLHEEVVRICKNEKVREILLDVFQVNKTARNFYKKEKFQDFIHILREKIRN